MTVFHSGHAFRLCRMSATVHAQSRPIRLGDKVKEKTILKIIYNS